MIISNTVFIICLWMWILLCLAFIYIYRKKKKLAVLIGFICFIGILIMNLKPASVYTVTNCGVYKKEKLLLSKKINDTLELSTKRYCYIHNQSRNTLYVSPLQYGNIPMSAGSTAVIRPGVWGQLQEGTDISFFFNEKIPDHMLSKENNTMLYWLHCE